ncbi:AMP-binding protein [bacterium]|nr:AMP-binding protein [bacterium]
MARDPNIAWTLTDRAASDPELAAIYEPRRGSPDKRPYDKVTFQELEAAANRLAHLLRSTGLTPGTRAVLMVPPSRAFFELTFAVFKAGIVPVFIDPGMGIRGLGKCMAESRATAFIGITKAHIARRLFGWGRGQITRFVSIGKAPGVVKSRVSGQAARVLDSAQFPAEPPDSSFAPDDTAAVLFTSGSTGPAKGVVYTHRIFNAQVRALRDLFDIRPGEVDLCTFPLFALFAPALGMTSVFPKMDFTRPGKVDPREVIVPVDRFGVTNLFGSPALLRRVGGSGETSGTRLKSLKRVVSAGAPVPADVIARIVAMLPDGAQVHTPYGATESLPVACIGSNVILGETAAKTALGQGVCVGKPVQGMKVAVVPVTDEAIPTWSDSLALPPGQIGEIVVSADQVTQSYDARPEANAKAKILDSSADPPRYRHRMGDLGYLDDQGRLWFCGRKAHRVWTASGPLDTIPTEALFNQHPDVFRTALVGVGERSKQVPVICVQLEQGRGRDWKRVEAELLAIAARHPHLAQIRHFLPHKDFPVDVRHNSKIFREKLAVWASGRVR